MQAEVVANLMVVLLDLAGQVAAGQVTAKILAVVI
jgi:hypothetical protein